MAARHPSAANPPIRRRKYAESHERAPGTGRETLRGDALREHQGGRGPGDEGRMTAPRIVVAGATMALTRRTVSRRAYLAPWHPLVEDIWLYALAY
ncbi:MAG TPA: hypothetical protein RMH26_17985, partial [Polyangiaceae bacterium LLY-WYZ-15_(1-7)]|nr:hypothetical protein [Polyangiaceae bacterium LLY-WYZ-15_(1-7)]